MPSKRRAAAERRIAEQRESLPATDKDIYSHGYKNGLYGASIHCCPFPLDSDGGRRWLEGHKAGIEVFNDIAEDQMRGDPSPWGPDLLLLLGIFMVACWLIYKIYR